MIFNFLSQLKNASLARNEFFESPYSTFSENVASLLKKHNFIRDYKVFKKSDSSFKGLRVDMLYEDEGEPRIKEVKIVSKPGLRNYSHSKNIFPVKGGRGVVIVSTPQGLMDGREAKKRSLGGEVICKVY